MSMTERQRNRVLKAIESPTTTLAYGSKRLHLTCGPGEYPALRIQVAGSEQDRFFTNTQELEQLARGILNILEQVEKTGEEVKHASTKE